MRYVESFGKIQKFQLFLIKTGRKNFAKILQQAAQVNAAPPNNAKILAFPSFL